MGPDLNEPNEFQANAAFVGSGSTLQIQHASIFPNFARIPGRAQRQRLLPRGRPDDRHARFPGLLQAVHPALLPAGGNLDSGARRRRQRHRHGAPRQLFGTSARRPTPASASRRWPGRATACTSSAVRTPMAQPNRGGQRLRRDDHRHAAAGAHRSGTVAERAGRDHHQRRQPDTRRHRRSPSAAAERPRKPPGSPSSRAAW